MSERMNHVVWYPGHELLLQDIVRAENCYLYDSRGNRYVDLESGVWCTSLGHGNPRILRVMADQVSRIGHFGFCYCNGVVEDAAQEILGLTGFENGKCVFLCSGSEAVEYGVRVAQSVIDRPLIMTMADSYFGAYGSASKREQGEWFVFDWTSCAACCHSLECDERCANWASIPWDSIGGFLFEPGSSSGLVRFPPEKLIRNIVAALRKHDGLVVVNEVTTGVGRTGLWFGYQHYGICPDIIALGKGIGNGYPVSVTAIAPGVIERLGDRQVAYAQSHQNDPLGAAIVREVICIITEERLIEKAQKISALLSSGLGRVQTRTSRIKEVRSRGLMIAVELNDDAAFSFTIGIHRALVRQGYVVGRRPGTGVLRLDPSLTIDSEDIAGFLETLEVLLVEADSGKQGL